MPGLDEQQRATMVHSPKDSPKNKVLAELSKKIMGDNAEHIIRTIDPWILFNDTIIKKPNYVHLFKILLGEMVETNSKFLAEYSEMQVLYWARILVERVMYGLGEDHEWTETPEKLIISSIWNDKPHWDFREPIDPPQNLIDLAKKVLAANPQ